MRESFLCGTTGPFEVVEALPNAFTEGRGRGGVAVVLPGRALVQETFPAGFQFGDLLAEPPDAVRCAGLHPGFRREPDSPAHLRTYFAT
ncbi:hypothetical protein [Streptomyces sp. MP131-18]|uniref:hypothetical protein n=1 Tax=Streptomyces sp. MP131-18 TaxID=1857892 RepID=UPI00097C99FA|nr:hypothetical protein [Streptomyces sp. MP131-18]ONK14221.1 hypothetical protein STBA_50010 [Streptomyces sp. MP131-18]